MVQCIVSIMVFALLVGAMTVIAVTLRDHADAIIAALGGDSTTGKVSADFPRPRHLVRTLVRHPMPVGEQRAAA